MISGVVKFREILKVNEVYRISAIRPRRGSARLPLSLRLRRIEGQRRVFFLSSTLFAASAGEEGGRAQPNVIKLRKTEVKNNIEH